MPTKKHKLDPKNNKQNITSAELMIPVPSNDGDNGQKRFFSDVKSTAHYFYVFGGVISFLLILSILTALFLYSLINNNFQSGFTNTQAFNDFDQIKRTIRSEIIELERSNQSKLDDTMVQTINFISLLSNSKDIDLIQEIDDTKIEILDTKNEVLLRSIEELRLKIRENHPFLIELGEPKFIKDDTFSRSLLFTNNNNQLALIKVIFVLDVNNNIIFWKIDPKIRSYSSIEYDVVKKKQSILPN